MKAVNVDTHKSVRLSIDVPIENAMRVLELFGWPSMVNPVAVAIAPLDVQAIATGVAKPEPQRKGGKLSQQAALLCQTGAFWKFMEEQKMGIATNEREAAGILHRTFGIVSRAEIDHHPLVAKQFNEIKSAYDAWMAFA